MPYFDFEFDSGEYSYSTNMGSLAELLYTLADFPSVTIVRPSETVKRLENCPCHIYNIKPFAWRVIVHDTLESTGPTGGIECQFGII